MNREVKVTWRMLRTISHSLMIHVKVSEDYIHLSLINMADNILPVLPIRDLINEESEPTMPFKLATGTKPSILHLRVLFCPCVVHKGTSHVDTKELNMHHKAQKGFWSIFIEIPHHQRYYIAYIPHK